MAKDIIPVDWNSELTKRGIGHYQIGDQLIDRDGRIYEITEFGYDSYNYPCIITKSVGSSWSSTHYIRLDEASLEKDHRAKYHKLYADPETVFQDAVEYLNNPPEDKEQIDTETKAMTLASGQAAVNAHKAMLQERENRIAVMEAVMKRRMSLFRGQATLMERQLKYTRQVIRLMELFLGVYEDVVTLRTGQAAPADYPINIRQLVLYMDEEVGTIQYINGQRGIDFQSIEEFDNWLLEDPKHLDLVLPEGKGIVALRPSRQEREYSRNFLVNMKIKDQNNFMYLLIRNGENLYRVFTDVRVGNRLFPTQVEMNEVMEKLNEAESMSYDEEKARDQEISWRYKAAIIQGLIERTAVLHPLPSDDVSLFNPDSFDRGDITLIRDAEVVSLPDGRLSFKEWRKAANENIQLGSRVVLTDVSRCQMQENRYEKHGDAWAWRYGGHYYHWTPEAPDDGVYVIVDEKWEKLGLWDKEPRHLFKIMYMPRHRWSDSNRRQGFWFEANDEFVLNYDAFNMDDITYYVTNRLERPNYLSVIPQMFNLRDLRHEEIEDEKLLVFNFATRYDVSEADVWDALEWWKRKNKLQRPMREDESKAWRMIRRHLGIASE